MNGNPNDHEPILKPRPHAWMGVKLTGGFMPGPPSIYLMRNKIVKLEAKVAEMEKFIDHLKRVCRYV